MDRKLVLTVKASDCEWEYFPAGKNGGQKGNKTASACRVRHPPSGAVAECREERSQLQNRKIAFKRLVGCAAFKIWMSRELLARDGVPTPEERVEKDMEPDNLRIEVRQDGKWTSVEELN